MATDDPGLPIDERGKPDMSKAPAWARYVVGLVQDMSGKVDHLHGCLHRVEGVVTGDRVAANARDDTQESEIGKLKRGFEDMAAQVAAIAKGLGVPGGETDDSKPKKTLALISRWQAVGAVFGSIGGALLLLKVLDAFIGWLAIRGPELWRSLVAIS